MSHSKASHKSWIVLDDTLPAPIGQSLLGTFVPDVQRPINRYEPKFNSTQSTRQHPYLESDDILEPFNEDRTITAGNNRGRNFELGLCAFVSGNLGTDKARQAQITSTCITTHSIGSPDDVFKKLRNNPKCWAQVEKLMLEGDVKKLYFVTGYKTATDPIITMSDSNQRSQGLELTVPVITAATGGVTLPAGITLGDPRLALGRDKGDVAAQHGLVKGERLFAVQYWALVKKRTPVAGQNPSRHGGYRWGRSNRVDGVEPRRLAGNNIMFGADSDEEDEDDVDDEDDVNSDDGDSEEWGITEYSEDA